MKNWTPNEDQQKTFIFQEFFIEKFIDDTLKLPQKIQTSENPSTQALENFHPNRNFIFI